MMAKSEHSKPKPRHVVVVGGGLAGLAAAECIARTDPDRFRVTVLEAKRTAGGRAGSFTDPVTAESIDYCQHVGMGCCTNLLGLLARNGLSDAMRRYRNLTFFHPDFPPSEFSPVAWLPPPLHLATVIGNLSYLDRKQKREIRRGLWKLIRTPSRQLDDVVALDWLRSHGQSERSIRSFWDVILTSALGEHSQYTSMAAARKVFVDGFAAARGASDVLVPDRPLRRLIGRDLVAAIKNLGVEVRCGAIVQEITTARQQHPSVQLRGGHCIDADHVIIAVPWHVIASLFRDAKIAAAMPDLKSFKQIPASPISGIHLWFDRVITNRPHAVLVDSLTQWLFRQPFGQSQSAEANLAHYYQVVISGSHPLSKSSKDEMVAQVLSELAAVFPATQTATLLRHRVVTDPNSVFSIRPAVERLRPPPCPAPTELPWLCLAGDWTRTGWPATMEGAVISGIQAASGVFENAGLPSIAADPGLKRGWLANRIIAS
ncbi:Carotene 7,8-desaturase [Rhodopirellula maiorica SM1]|uniref:Carotene 7,8-desaturase n=1 Tax=Rhodopirellula maiorica SM1 TaxID=1265738 RepID=M5RXD2_9BACT|nr:hydroxysqualene dehydroxylase HpnE [Rhodopirellula maiorica]EMI18604.1 Carotene 7,8-desaturase [Rhodopirellula maiorica SM1]